MIPEEVANMRDDMIQEGMDPIRAIVLAWRFYNMFNPGELK